MSSTYIAPNTVRGETRTTDAAPLPTIPEQLEQRQSAARSEHLRNLLNGLNDAIATVNVATPKRDASVNGRQRYERNYQRCLEAARQYVLASGEQVDIPAYLPPPARSDQITRVGPDSFPTAPADDSHVRSRKAAERAADIRPGSPGTGAEIAWLNVQGGAK